MATKKQELIDGCFAKAGDNEPLFVLRATDVLAPNLVRDWADKFRFYRSREDGFLSQSTADKYLETMAIADAMERWPNRKLPD